MEIQVDNLRYSNPTPNSHSYRLLKQANDRASALRKQVSEVKEELAKISFASRLTELNSEIAKKDYQIESLERQIAENTALIIQQSNQKLYEEQLQVLHLNYENVLKKLDRVRNLVIDDSLEKLKSLVRRGEV